MSGFEFNKIAGALLFTALVVIGARVLTNHLYGVVEHGAEEAAHEAAPPEAETALEPSPGASPQAAEPGVAQAPSPEASSVEAPAPEAVTPEGAVAPEAETPEGAPAPEAVTPEGTVASEGAAAPAEAAESGVAQAPSPEAPSVEGAGVEAPAPEAVTPEGAVAPEAETPEAGLAALLAAASPEAGQKVAKKCTTCHSLEKGGANKVGPALWGVVGRAVASAEGFAYSDALKGLGGEWTFERLDEYLSDPKAYAPGTTMSFPGLKSEADRAALIALLRTLSDAPAPLPGQ